LTRDGSNSGAGEEDKRELVPAYCLYDREVTFRVTNGGRNGSGKGKGKGKGREGEEGLAVPAVVSYGQVKLEEGEGGDTFSYRNFADGERTSSFSASLPCRLFFFELTRKNGNRQRRSGTPRLSCKDEQDALDRLRTAVCGCGDGVYGVQCG
jgi:hypothetical protein